MKPPLPEIIELLKTLPNNTTWEELYRALKCLERHELDPLKEVCEDSETYGNDNSEYTKSLRSAIRRGIDDADNDRTFTHNQILQEFGLSE